MRVRLADTKDKSPILRLLDEFSSLFGSEDIPSKVGGAIFDEIISRDDTQIFVVEVNDNLVGVATLYLLPNIRHGWKRGHIEDLFVTAKYRKKGVGSLLFSEIKKYCQKNNIRVIKLDSGNDLTEAHSFYKKHGGKTTERFFRFDIN